MEELSRKADNSSDKEASKIRKTIKNFVEINDEIKETLAQCQNRSKYQDSVDLVRKYEHFEQILPSSWAQISGSLEPSLEISDFEVA